ncbi:MAG: hypothetical protein LQ350_004948 [Teloschistes chrysophthalmus]|nr:MAG: hypothetical protein LQ350_004948 [Niorma chrysophthalma]
MLDSITPTKPRNAHSRSQSTPFLPAVNNAVAHKDSDTSHANVSQTIQLPSLTHPSRSTSKAAQDLPPLATTNIQPPRPSRPTSRFADWFSGESDPISFNLVPSPTKERSDPVKEMALPVVVECTSTCEEKTAVPNLPKPPIMSRFSFFGSRPSVAKTPLTLADVDDEWLKLDVKSALSPHGPADPFSPSSFKNLQQNAEGLLSRFHGAYKDRSVALHDAIAEKETQAEELQGAQMRTKHLKQQLDEMTAKLAEQDKAMMDLVDQLAQEKQARREAEDARRQACNANALGDDVNRRPNGLRDARHDETSSKSRTSTASEMSLESTDSAADSLFDRRGSTSPTMSMSSVSTMNSPEIQHQPSLPSARYQTPNNARTTTKMADSPFHPPQQPAGKNNNKGSHGRDSEAWCLVEMLKLENTGLKTRLSQLESTVADCLDMVKGLL